MHITIRDSDTTVQLDVCNEYFVKELILKVLAALDKPSNYLSRVRLRKGDVDITKMDKLRTITECGVVDGDVLFYSTTSDDEKNNTKETGEDKEVDANLNEEEKRKCAPLKRKMSDLETSLSEDKNKKRKSEIELTEEEKKCKKFFNRMKIPRIKSEVYFFYRPLHDQYINNPLDYDGFKREYALYAEKLARMNDPNSQEGQELLREKKNNEYLNSLWEEARSKIPQTFYNFTVPFINVVVNGVPAIASIDSGAMVSFMSSRFAKKAGLESVIDKRVQGIIFGTGGAVKMDGFILCPIEIERKQFDVKFDVFEDYMDMTLGLNFLRSHRCQIDFTEQNLKIDGVTLVPLLSGAEIGEYKRKNQASVDRKFEFDEDKLAKLIAMGFAKENAQRQLGFCGNNLDDAVRSLYDSAQNEYLKKKRESKQGAAHDNTIVLSSQSTGNELMKNDDNEEDDAIKLEDVTTTHVVFSESFGTTSTENNNGERNAIAPEIIEDGKNNDETLHVKNDEAFTNDVLVPDDNDCQEILCNKVDEKVNTNTDEDDEKKCRTLFDEMKMPKIKCEIYFAWKPLHDQYINNPSDYDGFKNEHSKYLEAERKKVELMNDPSSEEGRALVIEKLNKEKCDERLATTNLDLFKKAHLVYIPIIVNGFSTHAFVDTGSVCTSLSLLFAEKCGMVSKMDTRYRRTVAGLGGNERISGIIYSGSVNIENREFVTRFSVFNDRHDVVIGIDFMVFHGCVIDLSENKITFNKDVHVNLLSEKEVEEFHSKSNPIIKPKCDAEKLKELVKMGFEKKSAQAALMSKLNDVPEAVKQLYSEAQEKYEEIISAIGADNSPIAVK